MLASTNAQRLRPACAKATGERRGVLVAALRPACPPRSSRRGIGGELSLTQRKRQVRLVAPCFRRTTREARVQKSGSRCPRGSRYVTLSPGIGVAPVRHERRRPRWRSRCATSTRSTEAASMRSRGIELDVADGEFVTLLGPSGSGKTTLLMVLAGFEQATRGSVHASGGEITGAAARAPELRRRVPELRAVPAHERRDERRVSARRAARRLARAGVAGGGGAWRSSASTASATGGRPSSPAASSSASRWPARWSTGRRCSCSTSRSARSTARCATACRSSCGACTGPRRDVRVRHARSGRGPDHVRSHRRHARRAVEQIGTPGRGLRATSRPSSWRRSWAGRTSCAARVRNVDGGVAELELRIRRGRACSGRGERRRSGRRSIAGRAP